MTAAAKIAQGEHVVGGPGGGSEGDGLLRAVSRQKFAAPMPSATNEKMKVTSPAACITQSGITS